MKKIIFEIRSGEKSRQFTLNIPKDVFQFLSLPGFGFTSFDLVSDKIRGDLDDIYDQIFDLKYVLLYELLENNLGITYEEISDLEIVDYNNDEFFVMVRL